MKRGTLVSLTTVALTLVVLACRDLTAPHELTPGSSTRLLNPSGQVVVSPGDMHGWSFYNDQNDTPCTDSTVCRLVDGPTGEPLGSGSAYLATPTASDGKALVLKDYAGTRFDAITELRYSTFRQSVDSGRNLAIALQVNADYDLTDQSAGYQGRLVYEPYQSAPGTVTDTTWQSWDARAGKWWGTKASVPRGGALVSNPCVQSSPCTWAQLLAAFPNVGIHVTYGAVVLKAGSSWPGFRGNVDALAIGIGGTTTTFDFELQEPSPAIPPDSVPHALFDSLGVISGPPFTSGPYRKDIVLVEFNYGASQSSRQAAIDSVGGQVVGGIVDADGQDGAYYVRIQGGTTAALLSAVEVLVRQPQVDIATWLDLAPSTDQAYRRPKDEPTRWRNWIIDRNQLDPTRQNWALEYVNGPMAWGCSVGSKSTSVAVVDLGMPISANIDGNVDRSASLVSTDYADIDFGDHHPADHGPRAASVIAAVGNDTVGMTGMAWHARLILRDLLADKDNLGRRLASSTELVGKPLEDHLVAAGEAGADVINLSLAKHWTEAQLKDTLLAENVLDVRNRARIIGRAIDRLARKGRRPLFVLSAGNSGVSARLAGYPGAKTTYPNQVLVVGGLGTNGAMWEHSNRGDLVDVYAPAVNVAQANAKDVITTSDIGTSFSAPLAAGAAVLMKDFDASLSSTDLVKDIRDGARVEGGLRKLDAYGALRKTAERPGAPLCGSRVFKTGNAVFVMRGATADTLIKLSPVTADSNYSEIDVFHGGKRMDVGLRHAYAWSSTTRRFELKTPYRFPGGDTTHGGAYLSARGSDHERIWTASTIRPPYDSDSSPETSTSVILYQDSLGWVEKRPSIVVAEVPIARPTTATLVAQAPGGYDHWDGTYNPTDSAYIGSWSQARVDGRDNLAVAMAPSGEYAVVAINFVQRTNTADGILRDCTQAEYPDYPPKQCASGTASTETDSTTLYRVDVRGLAPPRRIASLPGVEIEWLALSEAEDEIIWQSVVRSDWASFRYAPITGRGIGPWYESNADSTYSRTQSCTGRKLEYRVFDRRAATLAPIGASKPAFPRTLASGCLAPVANLAGTISPSRSPITQGSLMVAPTVPSTRRARGQRTVRFP